MPELPEVDAARRLAARVALGRRIAEVACAADPIVFAAIPRPRSAARCSADASRRSSGTASISGSSSTGARGRLALRHDRRIADAASARVKLVSQREGERPPGWPPRFTKLHLTFADGGELVLADGRRLGRVRLDRIRAKEPPIGLLGFDALLELPSPARFAALLAERGAPIKALLLDQTFAAGVGNWIADEVLYQARIAPGAPCALAVTAGSRSPAARAQARRRDRGRSATPTATATRKTLALSPSLGQKRGRGHRARRAHPPRHDRRPHDRLGPHRPALRLTTSSGRR